MAEGTRHPVGIARVVLVEIVRHPAGEPGLRIADMSGTLARLLVIRIRSFLWMQRASEFDLATAVPRQTASPGIFSMKKGRP